MEDGCLSAIASGYILPVNRVRHIAGTNASSKYMQAIVELYLNDSYRRGFRRGEAREIGRM